MNSVFGQRRIVHVESNSILCTINKATEEAMVNKQFKTILSLFMEAMSDLQIKNLKDGTYRYDIFVDIVDKKARWRKHAKICKVKNNIMLIN